VRIRGRRPVHRPRVLQCAARDRRRARRSIVLEQNGLRGAGVSIGSMPHLKKKEPGPVVPAAQGAPSLGERVHVHLAADSVAPYPSDMPNLRSLLASAFGVFGLDGVRASGEAGCRPDGGDARLHRLTGGLRQRFRPTGIRVPMADLTVRSPPVPAVEDRAKSIDNHVPPRANVSGGNGISRPPRSFTPIAGMLAGSHCNARKRRMPPPPRMTDSAISSSAEWRPPGRPACRTARSADASQHDPRPPSHRVFTAAALRRRPCGCAPGGPILDYLPSARVPGRTLHPARPPLDRPAGCFGCVLQRASVLVAVHPSGCDYRFGVVGRPARLHSARNSYASETANSDPASSLVCVP